MSIKYQIVTASKKGFDKKESFDNVALAQAKIDQSYANYSHSIIPVPKTIGIGLKLYIDKGYYGEIIAEDKLFWIVQTSTGKISPYTKTGLEDKFFKKIFVVKEDENE